MATPSTTPAISATSVLAELKALKPRNAASLRAIRKRLTPQIANVEPKQVLAFANTLIDHGERFMAFELLLFRKIPLTRAEIEHLGRGMNTWDQVDTFGCYISGVAWRKGELTDAAIRAWARSGDLWWRRAALVSTVPLNLKARGGTGDPDRTLPICAMLVADREDMVVKAMSWALRCLCSKYPDCVTDFLAHHEVAARVRREVSNKLLTGLKNPARP